MTIDKQVHTFFNAKRMVKEIAGHTGRFFNFDSYEYKGFFEERYSDFIATEVPEFNEKDPDALSVYFATAYTLYLAYDLFSLRDSRFCEMRDALAQRLRECIRKLPRYNWVSHVDSVAIEFGIIDYELDAEGGIISHDGFPKKWLHHGDTWLDEILQDFRKYVDTDEIPEKNFSGFLWLYLEHFGHALPCTNENCDIICNRDLHSLAKFCTYARTGEKLFENVSNYLLNYFYTIKSHSLSFERGLKKFQSSSYHHIDAFDKKQQLQHIEDLKKEAAASNVPVETLIEDESRLGQIFDALDDEKRDLYTTINDNAEFLDFILYGNFLESSKEIPYTLWNGIRTLVNKAFDQEDVQQEDLLRAMRFVLNQNEEIQKRWPFLTLLCYLNIRYLEEEELISLFKKRINDEASPLKEMFGDDEVWVLKDIKECPCLQRLLFFALFDLGNISEGPKQSNVYDEYLIALKNGTWASPDGQSLLFNKIMEAWNMNCSIAADDMTLAKCTDKSRFTVTQSILNLLYNAACYAGTKSILCIVQQINNVNEHRKVLAYPKVLPYFEGYKENSESEEGVSSSLDSEEDDSENEESKSGNSKKGKRKCWGDLSEDQQKKLEAEFCKMKKLDCGFPIEEHIQGLPGKYGRYFSRRFEFKLFQESDVSCVPENSEGILQQRDFYLKRNRRMMECGYLQFSRNMKTHNVLLKYTESLLNARNYPDLLRLLYTVMRQLQRDCKLPMDHASRLFLFEKSACDSVFEWNMLGPFMAEAYKYIDEGAEDKLLDLLKYFEALAEPGSLTKDSGKNVTKFFRNLAELHQKIREKFESPNLLAAAEKVSSLAKEQIDAVKASYDAVSYDLFKDEPNYGFPLLKKCIALLLQVIQCVTSTKGVVEKLKEPSEFNTDGCQRLMNAEGKVTFEGLRKKVKYSDKLKEDLRTFLDVIFGVGSLRKSKFDQIDRDVISLYGPKIMLYVMKVTLQMTRLDLKELYKVEK